MAQQRNHYSLLKTKKDDNQLSENLGKLKVLPSVFGLLSFGRSTMTPKRNTNKSKWTLAVISYQAEDFEGENMFISVLGGCS